MHRAAHRTIRGIPALVAELRRVDIRKHALVEKVRDIDHVAGDAGIGGVEPRMAAARIGQAQRQPHGAEIGLYRRHLAGLEIHIQRMAEGAHELAHKAAGLAEIAVLRLLPGAGDNDGVDLAVIEQSAESAANKHRERRRGAQPRADRQRGLDDGVEAADFQPQLGKRAHDAADECLGCAELGRPDKQVVTADVKAIEALRLHMDHFAAVCLTDGV